MKLLFILLMLLSTFNTYARGEVPELNIKLFAHNVYIHKSFKQVEGFGLISANGLVVIKNNKAFIVDTPWSNNDTEKLVSWIKSKGYKLVGSVSTHSHDDRAAGIEWLNKNNIPTYASELTNQLLKENGKALATNTFTDSLFEIENSLLEVYYPGGGHTIDNIVVWLPKAKLLFGGCFVKSLHSKNLGYTGEAHIEQWPASINNVLSKYSQAQIVIPGHGKSGSLNLFTHTKKLAESAITTKIKE